MNNMRTPNPIETIMFDMDGTLLDLAFDSYFWLDAVPEAWAKKNNISIKQAREDLEPLFREHEGTLNWYSLTYWSEKLGIDLTALKEHVADRIQLRPNAIETLTALKESGRPLWLVTNAHPDALRIKLDKTNIAPFFDVILSSHELGHPKEEQEFWEKLQQQHPFNPRNTILVDDTLPVLHAAQDYGLNVLAITQPDSTLPPRLNLPFNAIDDLKEAIAATSHIPVA